MTYHDLDILRFVREFDGQLENCQTAISTRFDSPQKLSMLIAPPPPSQALQAIELGSRDNWKNSQSACWSVGATSSGTSAVTDLTASTVVCSRSSSGSKRRQASHH